MADTSTSSETLKLEDLQSYKSTLAYNDLTVRCGDHEWKVSRAIVCSKSKFFAAACNGSFQEATSKSINFPEDEPEDVELFLAAIYGAHLPSYYDGSSELSTSTLLSQFILNGKLLALGDKYDARPICDAAFANIRELLSRELLSRDVGQSARLLTLPKGYEGLKLACAYRPFRSWGVFLDLLEERCFCSAGSTEAELLDAYPDLAVNLVRHHATIAKWVKVCEVDGCDTAWLASNTDKTFTCPYCKSSSLTKVFARGSGDGVL